MSFWEPSLLQAPFLWLRLVVYYLQVGRKEGPQLPPVKEFQATVVCKNGDGRKD